MHPAASALAWENRQAHFDKRPMAYCAITFDQIQKRIAAVPGTHPTWPPILHATDLSSIAEADARFTWWLWSDEEIKKRRAEQENQRQQGDNTRAEDEEGEDADNGADIDGDDAEQEEEDGVENEGEDDVEDEAEDAMDEDAGATGAQQIITSFLFELLRNLGLVRRRSSRTTKGRAPAQADVDVSDASTRRGKKRAADVLKREVRIPSADEDEDGDFDVDEIMDDPTPKKRGKGKAKIPTADFEVVVDSPPNRRPTQRLRTNEAGDAIDVSRMTREQARKWVATGAVSAN